MTKFILIILTALGLTKPLVKQEDPPESSKSGLSAKEAIAEEIHPFNPLDKSFFYKPTPITVTIINPPKLTNVDP